MSDAGSPYTSSQWQSNFGNSDTPLVIDENQSSTGMFSLFHDSWNAFPTFALIDHTMTVRAKPWTLDSNSNTSSCDGTNATISGWSGGSTSSFIQQLLDECGSLCEECSGTTDTDGDGIADECDDCNNMSGDTNDDLTVDILDIVTVVNIILNGGLNSSNYTECELIDANFNNDSSINVLDIIQIINLILGSNRMHADVNGHTDLYLSSRGDDLIISVDSSTPISGLQISFHADHMLDITLNDNSSDIYTGINVYNGIETFVGFSMENSPFDEGLEIRVEGGYYLTAEDMDIVVSSTLGTSVDVDWNSPEIQSFSIDNMYPNPFNPSTEINYTVDHDGNMTIAVYNILGQQITELYSGYQDLGSHKILWNADNIPSGVYYVNISHENGQSESMKAVLLK